MKSLAALGILIALVAPVAGGTGKVAPLFFFEEDGDTMSFWTPKTVRLVRHTAGSTKVCQSDLPENGNVWSASEVEQAFRNADVQNALKTTKALYSATSAAKVTSGTAAIVWAKECDNCLHEPDGVKRLHEILRTVLVNRRLLCK